MPTLELIAPQGIQHITETPSMPTIVYRARLQGYTAGQVRFEWQIAASWRGNGTSTRGTFSGTSNTNNDAWTEWQIPFNDQYYGGNVLTEVTAIASNTHYVERADNLEIRGTLPLRPDILREIGVAPWYIRRIAQHESGGMIQFNAQNGMPLTSASGDGGVGIFQITGTNQTHQEVWNWRRNVQQAQTLINRNQRAAETFWQRQVRQFNAWNMQRRAANRPVVAPPADITYNNVTFSFNPTVGQRSFADAIAIKMFNGAVVHFIVWDNVGAHAQNPLWRIHDLNNLGFNYVERICNTNTP